MLPIIQPGARSLWPVVRLTSTAGALSQGGSGSTVSIVVTDGRGEITVPSGAFTLTIDGDDYELDTADIIGQAPVFLTDPTFTDSDGGSPEISDTLTAVSGVYVYDPAGGEPAVGWDWQLLGSEDNSTTHDVTSDDIADGLGLIQRLVNAYGSSDSNEIEAIAPAPYIEQGVYFDGSTNYLFKSGGFDGVSDGDTMLFFASGELTADATGDCFMMTGFYGEGAEIVARAFDAYSVARGHYSGLSPVDMLGTPPATKGTRVTYLVAIDANGTSRLMVKIGSGAWTQAASDASGGGAAFDWTTNWYIGTLFNLTNFWKGNMYVLEAWFNISLPDVTNSTVQDMFAESTGVTKDPALAVAAYGPPALQLYGDSTTFASNRGTGGALALTGTLVDAI